MSYDEHGAWHPVHESYDELGLDERYSRPTMLAGAPVDRDDDGLAVLTPEQVEYVARITRLVQRSYDRRAAIGAPRPTVAPLPVPSALVSVSLRDLDIMSAVPDAIEGTRSTVRTGRTRTGKPTARVTGHGRRFAPVTDAPSGLAGGGSTDGAMPAPARDISLAAQANGLLRLNRDATTVSPVTGRVYGPDDVPLALMGSTVAAYQQMTPLVTGTSPLYVRDGSKPVLAWNGSPMPADETYGVHGDACGIARAAVDLAGWYDVPRDRGEDETGGYIGDNPAVRGTREHGLSWPIRTVEVKPRTAELALQRVTAFDDEVWHTLTHLVGYDGDGGLFIGHGPRQPRLMTNREMATTRAARDAISQATAERIREEALAIPESLVAAIEAILTSKHAGTVETPVGMLTIGEVGESGRVRLALARGEVLTPEGFTTHRVDRWHARASAGRIAARIMKP